MKFVLLLLVMLIFSYSSLGDYFSNEDDNLESKVIFNAIGVNSNPEEKNQFSVKKDELTVNIVELKKEISNIKKLDYRQEKLLDQSNQKNKDLKKIKTNEADLQQSQSEIDQNSEQAINIGELLDSFKIVGQDRPLMWDILILWNEIGDKEATRNQQSSFKSMFDKLSQQNKKSLTHILLTLLTTNEPNSKQVFNHTPWMNCYTLWMNCCAYFPEVFLSSILLYFIHRCFY